MKNIALIVLMTAAFTGDMCAWAAGTPCDGLAKLNLPHAEITTATLVAKGAFTPSGGGGGGGNAAAQAKVYASLPAFCRVAVSLHPSADSDIKMEVWMPADNWTGRLAEFGNGGFQSGISTGNLAQAVAKGYAGTASNTGKEGNNGDPLINHPEKLKDWGYRALHETLVAAKAISAAYYGGGPKYSYYSGCSTGGRQGWVGVEYYPNDYDGLAVGDPANPMTRLQAGSIWTNMVANKSEATYIPAAKWNMIHDTVLNQCDAVDGVKDGLIENPMACHFDPNSLLCKNGDAPNCLTATQVDTFSKVLSGAVNPRTGEQIYPGWPPGTVMVPGPILAKTPQQDAIDTFRVLFNDANWDYRTMDWDKDIAKADKLGHDTMDAVDQSQLGKFFSHGGKLLLYHGWEDPAITPLIQVQYYNSVVAANGGLDKTYNDMRLFLAPGMSHCGNGEGPNVFDKLDAISDWVEKDKAPDSIIATHNNSQGFIDRTRPLCPYPQQAKYKGTGNINDAENFVCAAP